MVAAFLNITGAFDNVHPSAIMNELKNVGTPAVIRKFVENLIIARTVHFLEDGNISDKYFAYKGTPQGSVLSPLLFNLSLSRIRECVGEAEFLQYADDIVIFVADSNPLEALSRVQKALNNIAVFLNDKGLDLSPSKSKWMTFTLQKNKPIASHSLMIKQQAVPRTEQSMPALFAWHDNPNIFLKLERLQYKAIRIALGYRQPINVMLCEARELSLKLRFGFLNERFILKCMSKKNHPVIDSLEHVERIPLTANQRGFIRVALTEAWAILQALTLALDAGYSRIIIFFDSRSVLEAVSSDKLVNDNYLIHRIKQLLLQLEEIGIESTFFWIPAHKGILGNEVADEAAKDACDSGARRFF
ncbi:PREDICTED: uncharacterized protein LOC108759015 [Trachymyrmex cornetzi]|uniref:uncharacterized protein LOC108759015 n=1 Tax=Trachymyrmex cornetzi TaxID=471704 RepID=UPI00084EEFC1|nr:PREDICTED: uncharacterized protein LOC108759015 [Trachymyrmex cornetzi]